MTEIKPPKPPTNRGRDALEWLELHGITPRRAIPLRSSDYAAVLSDPFGYYLTRHLGLASGLWYSKALNRGSWFHKRLEYFGRPDEIAKEKMPTHLKERIEELEKVSELYGYSPTDFQQMAERETKDYQASMAWYEASTQVVIPAGAVLGRSFKWPEIFTHPSMVCLGTELLLIYHDPDCPGNPSVVQLDRLFWNRDNNQLWALDAKTCEEAPSHRLTTCTQEFQTQHYLHVLHALLRSGMLAKRFPQINEKTVVGGMIHLAIQKPTINFDKRVDRPFKWIEHILKSGKRKGQVEFRKEFLSDEPKFELYLERVLRWYKGEGEYAENLDDRIMDPPVNMSFSGFNVVFDYDGITEYKARLATVYRFASMEPIPNRFLRNEKTVRRRDGTLSELAPFYLLPPAEWPTVVSQNRLIQSHRDDMIRNNTPTGVYLACDDPNEADIRPPDSAS